MAGSEFDGGLLEDELLAGALTEAEARPSLASGLRAEAGSPDDAAADLPPFPLGPFSDEPLLGDGRHKSVGSNGLLSCGTGRSCRRDRRWRGKTVETFSGFPTGSVVPQPWRSSVRKRPMQLLAVAVLALTSSLVNIAPSAADHGFPTPTQEPWLGLAKIQTDTGSGFHGRIYQFSIADVSAGTYGDRDVWDYTPSTPLTLRLEWYRYSATDGATSARVFCVIRTVTRSEALYGNPPCQQASILVLSRPLFISR